MIKKMLMVVSLFAATLAIPQAATAAEPRAELPSKASAQRAVADSKPAGKRSAHAIPGLTSSAVAKGPAYYFYAPMRQTLTTPSDGVSANFDVVNPWLSTYDYHTLSEISVHKGGSNPDRGQVVEVGINRDFDLYGDNNPHLFVFWWKNGVEQCYNGCGFVDSSSNPMNAGASVLADVGTQKVLGIQHIGAAWWVGYGPSWVGYFPDSLWSAATPPVTFTDVGFTQVFGEVAAGGTVPAGQPYPSTCTDMGSTTLATASTGTKIASVTYPSRPSTEVVLAPGTMTSPAWYNAALQAGTTRTFRYGGPSGC